MDRIVNKDGLSEESELLNITPPVALNLFIAQEGGTLYGYSEYSHAEGIFAAYIPPTVSKLTLVGPRSVGGQVEPNYLYESPEGNVEGDHHFFLLTAQDRNGINENIVATDFPYIWRPDDAHKHWKLIMIPADKYDTKGKKVETPWSEDLITVFGSAPSQLP